MSKPTHTLPLSLLVPVCKTRVAHGARSHEVSGLLQNVTSGQDYFSFIHCCTLAPCSLAVCAMSVQMSVIFSAGSLAVVQPPCVLQSFVNHGAVLHKVFVVGDRHFCVERPSLKNFPSGPSGQSAPDLLVLLCLVFDSLLCVVLSYPFLSFPFLSSLFLSFPALCFSFPCCPFYFVSLPVLYCPDIIALSHVM